MNNAAVTLRHPGTFLDLPHDAWERIVQVNLNGLFYCSQLAARAMVDGGGGAIVNVSSVHSVITSASGKATAYPATKAAINMFTRSLAVSWRRMASASMRSRPVWSSLRSSVTTRNRCCTPTSVVYRSGGLASPARSPKPSCFWHRRPRAT